MTAHEKERLVAAVGLSFLLHLPIVFFPAEVAAPQERYEPPMYVQLDPLPAEVEDAPADRELSEEVPPDPEPMPEEPPESISEPPREETLGRSPQADESGSSSEAAAESTPPRTEPAREASPPPVADTAPATRPPADARLAQPAPSDGDSSGPPVQSRQTQPRSPSPARSARSRASSSAPVPRETPDRIDDSVEEPAAPPTQAAEIPETTSRDQSVDQDATPETAEPPESSLSSEAKTEPEPSEPPEDDTMSDPADSRVARADPEPRQAPERGFDFSDEFSDAGPTEPATDSEQVQEFLQWQSEFLTEYEEYTEQRRRSADTTSPDDAPAPTDANTVLQEQLEEVLRALRSDSSRTVETDPVPDASTPGRTASPGSSAVPGISIGDGAGTRRLVSGQIPDLSGVRVPAFFPPSFPVRAVLSVDSTGRVTDVTRQPPSGSNELDDRIERAMRRWQFQEAESRQSGVVQGTVYIIVNTQE